MNWVEIAWSMMASASVTLGLVHLLVWSKQRSRYAHLAFFALTISVAAFSLFEQSAMRSQDPAAHAALIRWAHVPLTLVVLSILAFVHLYFRAGRLWLAYAAAACRLLALLLDFVTGVNLNFESVSALTHVALPGGAAAAVPIGVANPWQVVAQIGNVLLVAFVVDASVELWRRGDAVSRRRAALVGGSLGLCVVGVSVLAVLIVTHVVEAPTMLTPGFIVVVLAMGYELSADVVAAARLTDRLRISEAGLRTSEERFRAVIEAAPNAILLVDGEGRVALTNAQAHSLFGYSREEMIGQPAELLVPPRYRPLLESYRGGDAAEARSRVMGSARELQVQRKDGEEVPVEAVLQPMRTAAAMFVLVSLVDLTERRNIERTAARQRDEIAHLSRVSILGELSGSLAHELNQPLTAILSNAQAAQRLLARDPPQLDSVAEILADIVKSDRRAGAVIQRLRSLLRKEETQRQPFDVNDAVQDALRLMHSDLLSRRVLVTSELAEKLPAMTGDRVQLQQVLLNLVINGCDAMEGQDCRRCLSVRTRATAAGNIEICVTDDGGGIPPQDLERIFEPFVTTKPQGLGLGLAICRSIVESHGGRLWATNNAERGATFHVELPAQGA